MTTPVEFLNSLKPGDLVAATVMSSSKLHLVHVVRRVTRDMVRGEPSDGALTQMFDCKPLCEVRPRYWWRPTDALEAWQAEDRCRWCFSRWRSAKRPAIRGWAKAEVPIESAYRLPWGWHEVTTQGHPLDLPIDGPDPEPGEDEKKVGEKRVEVRRWLRGNRYVRITQSRVDKRFCLRFGDVSDKPDEESTWAKGGWDGVLLLAITCMALGGHQSHATKKDKLTMKDVQLKTGDR